MYELILSADDRQWLECDSCCDLFLLVVEYGHASPPNWDHDGDITFVLREDGAWAIKELGELWGWPCPDSKLCDKLDQFCRSVS